VTLSSISECGKHTFKKKKGFPEKCGLPRTPTLINSAELVKMWMNAFCSRASLKPNLVQMFKYCTLKIGKISVLYKM
jgi:ribosomal protein L37E